MKKMSNFIDHLQCPSINGIIYPNNKIQLIDIEVKWQPSIHYIINGVIQSSINDLQHNGELEWNNCAVLDVFKDKTNNIEIYTGESDLGSEGFIAVIDMGTMKLLWMAFFEDSNPFKGARVENGYIYATSTNNCQWIFNISPPELISVDCYPIK